MSLENDTTSLDFSLRTSELVVDDLFNDLIDVFVQRNMIPKQ